MLTRLNFLTRKIMCTRNLRLYSVNHKPIRSILVANRGEIAVRVFRACKELKIKSIAIYSYEDRAHLFRIKADESYLVGEGLSPIEAYLSIPDIINICKKKSVDAVHPGIGFLAERHDFAEAVIEAGMRFIGPTPDVLKSMGDKIASRSAAIAAGVVVVPGTDGVVKTWEEANDFCNKHGLPVILKAAYGGGGKGMRIVRKIEEVEENFRRASSEALGAFGDGSMFVERFIENPRHIEVQLLGDKAGNVIHLYERDCSVQRRHQKVIQIAPSPNFDANVREKITSNAVNLAKFVKYENAGTCEFVVDQKGNFYFIEVNPRLQVEHPTTESVTGVDIVKSQILIADGKTLPELGLTQDAVKINGFAVQCAVTTEDPSKNFQPDTGKIEVFQPGEGNGIRLDGASGFPGAVITPYYDSLLVKVIALAPTFETACTKMLRCLTEFRVRGVKTNIPFLLNVFTNPIFLTTTVNTSFVDTHPELFNFVPLVNGGQSILKYCAEVLVNGCPTPFFTDLTAVRVRVEPPTVPRDQKVPNGLRTVLKEQGISAFLKFIRNKKELLLTDTTLRDGHQSLLASRIRTYDMVKIAPFIAHNFHQLFSLENWGGRTFDIALAYLHECPWDRLEHLRKLIPNIPFQMLLRGTNCVGLNNYPDNVVFEFCKLAVKYGIDIFRVYDCFNYVPNLTVAMEAVAKAGGVVEAAFVYTGDISNPKKTKYDLNYYLKLADDLVKAGTHILGVKDMAGLLKPESAGTLVKAIRSKYPQIPLHIHTHDSSGAGIATLLAAADAGADIVDVAIDSMSGMNSQPSMGALVVSLQHTPLDTGIPLPIISEHSAYWEDVRTAYSPFECTAYMKSGNIDVYKHEIPGGHLSNLKFVAEHLGLGYAFDKIKQAYFQVNILLGDIPKVGPSSKIISDLAVFMVQNNLTTKDIEEKADQLSLPKSFVDYCRGQYGPPPGGYPEKLRKKVLRDLIPINGRPGESMEPFDFQKLKKELLEEFSFVTDKDILSAVFFPKHLKSYLQFLKTYGSVDKLDTSSFLMGPKIGHEYLISLSEGQILSLTALAISPDVNNKGEREVFFEFNGGLRQLFVRDVKLSQQYNIHPKADKNNKNQIGTPMPGVVKEIRVTVGTKINKGSPVAILTAMKMEVVVQSSVEGIVKEIHMKPQMNLDIDDLLVTLE
ncbi:hypothetical protein FQA39_LY10425 [Lamprigera yunnana]|nr:hypothetical protein FQA39_LY10425 [Lamprigera yunnana]